LEQRLSAQVFAIETEQIEDAVEQPRRIASGILQQLKARAAMRIERHQFAV
jgi:hypothetical protein